MHGNVLTAEPQTWLEVSDAPICEERHENARWATTEPRLSVLVPTYKDSADRLIAALGKCDASQNVEVIIYDDGSGDEHLTNLMSDAVTEFSGAACLISAHFNEGRSAARNRLQEVARSEWLLFLDADMLPDHEAFLTRYLEAISKRTEPALIVGGFSLDQADSQPSTALHRAQSIASECVDATTRNENPSRYVFTSNVLAHRQIMDAVPFDAAFKGWGWEDVDWGVRVGSRFDVLHIDNTATHLGLDPAKTLISKYGGSGENFWLALNRHPDVLGDTQLARMAKFMSSLPGRSLLCGFSRQIALMPGWIAPVPIRLLALKLYRAAVYGRARHART